LTGPVAVAGARPGDILKVEVLSAELWTDWGWNTIRAGKGALAGESSEV
jgi:acetamidase/formamidase